jgi:glycosyl transferase family 25
MEKQFASVGIDATRIAAVDGTRLEEKDLPPLSPHAEFEWQMSKSEIACALSHQKAWQLIAASGAAAAVVFEDDVKIAKIATAFLQNADWLPVGVECIKLDLSGTIAYHVGSDPLHITGYALTKPITSMGSTGGYILSATAASWLLQVAKVIGGPVDNQMFGINDPAFLGLNIRQIHPAICIQQHHETRTKFLTAEAAASSVETNGPWRNDKPMPFGLRKIRRELYRPVKRAMFHLRNVVQDPIMWLRYRARRIKVVFNDDDI